MNISATTRQTAQDLLNFIDASPSPWHAVASAASLLQAHDFVALSEYDAWQLQSGGRYFLQRGGAMVAFILGAQAAKKTGLRMVGAHTDSPGLRLKPKAAFQSGGYHQLGVEIYGGPILATFTDRDLSLAGRVCVKDSATVSTHLVRFDESLVRLPNLAIHMNRTVNEDGLKLNKQTGLPLILSGLQENLIPEKQLNLLIANKLNIQPDAILSMELTVYDLQKGGFWGANQEFIANSQLDNLAMCHAGITALTQQLSPQSTTLCALFDHEEVGSESSTGAEGTLLKDVIARIAEFEAHTTGDTQRMLARSLLISADMAHAFHPNHSASYEPNHPILVNAGPVIKTNVNQRYSTNAQTAAQFKLLCKTAKVNYQEYAHRTDLGCGSTIGPMVAAQLGVATVDVGNPMWAMHSLRESAGVADHTDMIAVLSQHFAS